MLISTAFTTLKRERMRQQLLDSLTHLITYDEQRSAYSQAQRWAWRQVALDPWGDEATRQLMRVLWRSGQRSAALEQYARHRQILQQDLAVEPSAETTALYERIRAAAIATPPAEEHLHVGHPERVLRAVRLLSAAATTRDMLGLPLPPGDRAAYERDVTVVRDQLDAAAWQAAWAEGQALTLEQALAEALNR